MMGKGENPLYDFAVIGTGAGGAVVAAELAEAGAKVVILEEGFHYGVADHHDTAHRAVDRLYRDGGFTTTLGSPVIAVPLGRAVGGTTLVNSGTCFRVPTPVRQRWVEQAGLENFASDKLDTAYEKVGRRISVQEGSFDVMSPSNRLVHDWLSKRGTPGKPLHRNIRDCDGCGFCCYGCPKGAKQSTDLSYMPLALKAGATLLTGAKVVRIKVKGPQRVELIYRDMNHDFKAKGRRRKVLAKNVIVSAGTLLSPLLLSRSGIGRGNRHLGRHLTIHPATKVFGQFKEELKAWHGTPQAYYYEGLKDDGILFEGVFVPPDIAAMSSPFVGEKLIEFMLSYKHILSFGFMISDTSEGRVLDLPFMGRTVLYDLTDVDVERIRRASVFLAELFLENGAQRVVTLLHGHQEIRTREDVDRLRTASLKSSDVDCMAFHPLGTCRMAKTSAEGVVDQSFKVFGTENVYVCDGSVIPTALGVNPQWTIMAFATLCAQKLLQRG